jgi:superfamily II RNA helicase
MEYKQFTLDPFQVDSIKAIEKNNSIVVSAATGTGKTLIADYIIDKAIKNEKRVFYTAPIKALSNQKYRDFKEEYGEEKIGLMTGDVVINPDAPIIVMTTEIYRNMLVVKDSIVEGLSYVIFDEVHYINDIERGTVWEESIIFSNVDIRFLCLSATIPNAIEFADWIMSIKGHQVDVVEFSERAVPLKHMVYEKKVGLTTARELKKNMDLDKYPSYNREMSKRKKKERVKPATHMDIIREVKNKQWYPAIFFVFSRKAVEEKALELFKTNDFINKRERNEIDTFYSEKMTEEIKNMECAKFLKKILGKGIGIHHAGMLPLLKEIVELLFSKGLIKILYATETFAVGINMPAKCVCFNTLEKYDGFQFRYLNSKEYYQMAGRAGRRGIDKEGQAILLVDREYNDIDKIIKITQEDCDPIISQFKLSVNTVINLMHNYDDSDRERILKSNFDYYLRLKKNKNIRIMTSFQNKVKLLQKMGYIEDNELTEKGRFCRNIYSNELLITEIFTSDIPTKITNEELLCIIASIVYEPRRGDKFSRYNVNQKFSNIIYILKSNDYADKHLDKTNLKNMIPLVNCWFNEGSFDDLIKLTSLEEGDIIRLFRQMIDFIRQIKKATDVYELKERLEIIKNKIDRDLMSVQF